jgi:putative endonuclease
MAGESVIWTLYILECADKTLYTGISNNVQQRIEKHEQGLGAKYTKGRGPFKLVYSEDCVDRATASRREAEVKALSRAQKQALIVGKKRL